MEETEQKDLAWGLSLPHIVLSSSSSYLVALIVLLQLLLVKKPTNYETLHKRVCHIGCPLIWTVSLLIPSIAYLIVYFNPGVFKPTGLFLYQFVATVPMLLTIVIYANLLSTLKQKTILNDTQQTSIEKQIKAHQTKRIKSLAKMLKGIVIALIICNLPGDVFHSVTLFYPLITPQTTNNVDVGVGIGY